MQIGAFQVFSARPVGIGGPFARTGDSNKARARDSHVADRTYSVTSDRAKLRPMVALGWSLTHRKKGVFGTSQTGDPAHEITSPPRWRRNPSLRSTRFPESSAYFADPRSIGGSGVFRLARAEHEEMRASSPTSIASRARVRRRLMRPFPDLITFARG